MADPKDSEFVYPTLTAVQRFFGIAYPTAKEWRNQGMPCSRGEYNLKAIFKWWLASGKAKWATTAKAGGSLDDEKLAIEVELKRLKLQLMAGQLVEKDAVYATIESMFHRVRTRLEAIPEEIGSSFPPDVRAACIEDTKAKIRLVLREMEHWAVEEGKP